MLDAEKDWVDGQDKDNDSDSLDLDL